LPAKKEKNMRKVGLLVLAALMSCALMFALVGCTSDEKAIRDGLTEELNQFKDPNSDLWKEIINSSGGNLDSMGLEAQALIAAWTEGFSFEVGEITIDGDSAQAKISITSKQLLPAVTSATRVLETLVSDPSNNQMTMDEITARMGELILDELTKSTPATTEITIPCSKTGNEWSEGAAATSEYTRALLGS
jgi:hypothetical protein